MQKLVSLRKLTFITLIAVYILILLGASVRASGSGMGCPDWPTCFGRLIPPTSASQLPENYRQLYAPKLAGGQQLQVFNVQKTWTEYLNRLFGIFVGLLSCALLLFSLSFRKKHPQLVRLTLSIFIFICLQGGLGALVVATNLLPGMISLHMMMALLILCLLIYLLLQIRQGQNRQCVGFSHATEVEARLHHKWVYYLTTVAFVTILLQMMMGTQVREMIDFASKTTQIRGDWLNLLGDFFYVHRSFSWVIIIVNSILLWKLYQHTWQRVLFNLQLSAIVFIVLQVVSGSLLNHLSFPIIVQPLHLLISTIILGIQFKLLCLVRQGYKNSILAYAPR